MTTTPTNVAASVEPEVLVVRDLVRRGLLVAPVLVLVCGAIWGVDGALSAGYGLLVVLGNFALSALIMSTAARISPTALMGAVLFGYLVRLGIILVAILVVTDASWFEPVPLGLTIIVTHLGLLFWETRYVSASLAFPGLKPNKDGR